MFFRFLLALALVSPATAMATDGPPPKAELDTHKMIQAGRVWHHRFKLSKPLKVNIKATVKTTQPVNFYVMKPREIRNYMAVGGSLDIGNFTYVRELYRQKARALHDSAVLDKGWWALVIHNPGPKKADVHVVLSNSTPPSGSKVIRFSKAQAGTKGGGSGPGRYELAITRYTVSAKKKNGQPWDSGDNAPDVQFFIQHGKGTGVANLSRPRGKVHKDRPAGSGPEEDRWVFDWDGRGPVIMFAYDKDLMSDDLIGKASIHSRKYPARGWLVLRGGDGSVAVTMAWRKIGELSKGFGR